MRYLYHIHNMDHMCGMFISQIDIKTLTNLVTNSFFLLQRSSFCRDRRTLK